jgi:hypothetical protein
MDEYPDYVHMHFIIKLVDGDFQLRISDCGVRSLGTSDV